MRSAADLRSAARRAGLRVVGIERVPAPGGGFTWATRMRFKDPWAAARLLQILADEDADDPVVRAWALEISQAALSSAGFDAAGPVMTPEMRALVAEAIHTNVQAQIRFIHEKKETFQAARTTMAAGAGDCDDHARLVYALARAAGLPAKLLFFDEDGQPVHVVSQIGDGVGYFWCETTIPAAFAEHPYEAIQRVGADAAADPMQQMGFLGLDFVTPGDVNTRKAQLDDAVTSLDADIVKCGAIDTTTLSRWNTFLATWRQFAATPATIWNAGGQGRQAGDYADQIRQWQEQVAKVCTLTGPELAAPTGDPIVSTVQAVAVVAVAGAVAWAISDTTRTIRVLRGRAA